MSSLPLEPAPLLIVDPVMTIMNAAFDPAWGEAWNRKQVSDALTMPHTRAILVAADGRETDGERAPAAGFVMARFAPGEVELLLIAVMPEFRRRGLGMALVGLLTQEARHRDASHIFLEMRDNNPAETLYRSCGFEPIGRRAQYYRTRDGGRLDAITFGLSI